MTTLDDIYAALLTSDAADIPAIKKYVIWVAARRRIQNYFYLQAHWVQRPELERPATSAHWI